MTVPRKLTYILITPPRNEERLIEGTIKAVIAQTALPGAWVIVTDDSSDKTDRIVAEYANAHSWIIHLRAGNRVERAFASKVFAFDVGYRFVTAERMNYEIIGNIDADITCGSDFFEYLIDQFDRTPSLGWPVPNMLRGHSSPSGIRALARVT